MESIPCFSFSTICADIEAFLRLQDITNYLKAINIVIMNDFDRLDDFI